MRKITSMELENNLSSILNGVEHEHEEFIIFRDDHEIARMIPPIANLTALEVMADLYGILPEEACKDWLHDSRQLESLQDGVKNPWDI